MTMHSVSEDLLAFSRGPKAKGDPRPQTQTSTGILLLLLVNLRTRPWVPRGAVKSLGPFCLMQVLYHHVGSVGFSISWLDEK